MPPFHETGLRAYSGRALMLAAAISSALHVALALALPRWGGGGGLPLLSRPPLLVRMEMARERREAGGKRQEAALSRGQALPPTSLPSEKGGGELSSPPSRAEKGVWEAGLSVQMDDSVKGTVANALQTSGKGEDGPFPAGRGGAGTGGLSFAGDRAGEGGSGRPDGAMRDGDGEGERAVEMWEVEEPPKQTRFVEPEYPPQARRMGVEGSVVVRYLVGYDGRVEQTAILEGPEFLRKASLRAVGGFVYEPIRHRGCAAKVWMRQVITFRLE